MEDIELALAAARGDQGAFELLVVRHRQAIYALAYRVTLNSEDALDVTQEVYLRMAERIASFRGRGTFRSWVLSITAREAMNVLRGRGRKEIPTEGPELEWLVESKQERGEPDVVEELTRQERLARVEQRMHILTPQQRAVLALRLQEGLGLQEISEMLSIPNGQVRSQLSQAVARLRKLFTKENTDAG